MDLTTTSGFAEEKLSALNARADARAIEHANDWDEAIDWGVPDYDVPVGVACDDRPRIRLTHRKTKRKRRGFGHGASSIWSG